MCLPAIPVALAAIGSFATSAAGAATLAVAGTAATLITESEAAHAQNNAITNELNQGKQQVQEQEVNDLNTRAREGRKEQSRMAVAAGEAGLQLSSGSVESMLLDSHMQTSLDSANIKTNADHQAQNLSSEANRYYSQVQQPSVVGAGLRLVSSGISGWNAGQSAVLAKQAISRQAAGSVT